MAFLLFFLWNRFLFFGWEYGIIGENEMQSFRHMNQI